MATIGIKPMELPPPPWKEGYVLDYHTISSTPTGDPYHPYDTKRTPLGELLYQLKYGGGGREALGDIVDTVEQFVKQWNPTIDCIVPAPPSVTRKIQPSVEVARELAGRLGIPMVENLVVKVKNTPQMKNIDDWSEREKLLGEAIQAGQNDDRCKSILLIDDIIESGSTLRRTAEVLLSAGTTNRINTLVLTRTK